jgi:predicted ABC-type transport system involved in lysophospholipase L1 biosynthesis ATPase subunit
MTESLLELRGVSKTYGQGAAEVHPLREVGLTVDAGTMVAVMGPSGSGKSTLLTIAGSLEEPTSGEVLVAGHALAGMSQDAKARLRRRTIGYVFQDFNLLPGLTAAENVSLPLELDGVPARKARTAGLRALEGLGLAGRAAQYPDQLSGGERQRAAIARARGARARPFVLDQYVRVVCPVRRTAHRGRDPQRSGGGGTSEPEHRDQERRADIFGSHRLGHRLRDRPGAVHPGHERRPDPERDLR